jgi:hypothetical protein
MNSGDNQLFSVEDALSRLGQNKEQGCLLAYKGAELITIYVQNGFILNATAGLKTGREAVSQAVHWTEASYQWIRGVQPPEPERSIFLNIQEFILTNGTVRKSKIAETGNIHLRTGEPAAPSEYSYFLVPENQPTVKLVLTKTATVLGRDKTSDLTIDDINVSGRHCILDVRNRGLFILDLDSTNGTYVNGVLIRDGYINMGDILELGSYRLTVNRDLKK